jgi:hypothetical protein
VVSLAIFPRSQSRRFGSGWSDGVRTQLSVDVEERGHSTGLDQRPCYPQRGRLEGGEKADDAVDEAQELCKSEYDWLRSRKGNKARKQNL